MPRSSGGRLSYRDSLITDLNSSIHVSGFINLLLVGVSLIPAGISAEPINAAQDYSAEEIAVVHRTGLGISGPGTAVVGDGVLSTRPAGFQVTAATRAKSATGLTVSSGLIPAITPIWDVHVRDTDVILDGDGNYYLTGSTGDDIWRSNDGIEL